MKIADNSFEEQHAKGPSFGARHVQFILLFGLFMLGASTKLTLPMTIVAMTHNGTSNATTPTYDWHNKDVILSSFYWGYIFLPIFGGKLATTFGTKWTLTIAVLITSTVSVMIPVAADNLGAEGVIICRVFQGVFSGLYSSLTYHVLALWTPCREMSRTLATLHGGETLGSIVTIAISGYISSSPGGWPVMYYLSGGMGFLWILPWIFFACDSPADHSTITPYEKNYIQASLSKLDRSKKIPWKAIFTSLPMAAILFSVVAKYYTDSLLQNEIFIHMSHIMKYSLEKSGLLLALPYLIRFLVLILGGIISDWLVNTYFLSRTNTRKIFNSIGTIIPGVGLPLLGFCTADQHTKYILTLVIVLGASTSTYHGCMLNAIDISPMFCGTLRGIISVFGNTSALILPLVANAIIKNETTITDWRILFVHVACLNILAGIFYIFFASGKVQNWTRVSKMKSYGTLNITPDRNLDECSM